MNALAEITPRGSIAEPKRETMAFPGEGATTDQMMKLADAYARASLHLLSLGQSGDRASWAPFRLNSIHAIELYLNALLIHAGQPSSVVRSHHHNMASRLLAAVGAGLALRQRTSDHLLSLQANREYLTSRYDAELAATVSEITRLKATLAEVAAKVTKIVARLQSGK